MPVTSRGAISPAAANCPDRVTASTGLTAAASTRIRTCPAPVVGTGTSTVSRASGPPNDRTTTARMANSLVGCLFFPSPATLKRATLHREVGTSKCVPNAKGSHVMPTDADARAAYDAYLAECPARQLLARIGDKWVSLVVNALADGPRRYGDLARTLVSVSQKMLTQTLRNLERDGLIARTVTPSVPVRVDYALTPLGESLLPLMRAIKTWAEDHMDDVLVARAGYDAGAAAG
ncbi:hypothetical protein GCM10020000_54180 [Streptomyces olivoverticillatus]